jgi:hypothetical protein
MLQVPRKNCDSHEPLESDSFKPLGYEKIELQRQQKEVVLSLQ